VKNLELFERAKAHIPSGVNSPVRAFGKVGGTPRFIREAKGPYLIDAEGKRYIDHVLSWGPMILGHSHPEVVEAVSRQAGRGMSFGAPTSSRWRWPSGCARPSLPWTRYGSSTPAPRLL